MSGFRRRLMGSPNDGAHITEGLDFWFDGLDNQANGQYDPTATTWVVKSNIEALQGYSLQKQSVGEFTTVGGFRCIPKDSTSSTHGVLNMVTPYNKLSHEYSGEFTIEIVIDLFEKNKYYVEGEGLYIFGVTFSSGVGTQWRGGLSIINDSITYRCSVSSGSNLQTFDFNCPIEYGEQVITIVLQDSSTMKLYINGEYKNSITFPGSFKMPNTTSNPFSLMGYDNDGRYVPNGIMYSYKSYNKKLSNYQIKQSYLYAKNRYFKKFKNIKNSTTIRINQHIVDPNKIVRRMVDNNGIELIRSNSHRYVGNTNDQGVMILKQLRDNDGTKYLDGTDAPIATLGNDVWMKLPQFWYKAEEYDTDVWDITFAYGTKPDNTFKEWDGKDLIGVYKAYISGSKMYSVSGVIPKGGYSVTSFDTMAKARGNGYSMLKWKYYCIMAFLFFCYYGTTNSNSICGIGDDWDNYNENGLCDSLGMTDTVKADDVPMNFWGLESWWGMKYEMIGNLRVNYLSWKVTEDDGTERTITNSVSQTSTQQYTTSKMFIGENLDLVPMETLYSYNYDKGYCNGCYIVSDSNRIFLSGYHGGAILSGIANIHVGWTTSQTGEAISSRLSYRGDYIIIG